MRIRIGPVASESAVLWTTHILANLEVVRARAAELPFRFPDDIADAFADLLTEWQHVAKTEDPFVWEAELDVSYVHILVQYWANLDSLTSEHLAMLGLEWSPPEARPFFSAVVDGVAQAFEDEGEPDRFAAFLAGRAGRQGG